MKQVTVASEGKSTNSTLKTALLSAGKPTGIGMFKRHSCSWLGVVGHPPETPPRKRVLQAWSAANLRFLKLQIATCWSLNEEKLPGGEIGMFVPSALMKTRRLEWLAVGVKKTLPIKDPPRTIVHLSEHCGLVTLKYLWN